MLDFLKERCPGLLSSHREVRGSVLIVPVGSFEDRPTGPAALDTFLALMVACEVGRRCGATVTPPLSFGHSPSHKAWAGLSREVLGAAMAEIVFTARRFMRAGKVVIVDGHYGNKPVLEQVAKAMGVQYINVWDVVADSGYGSGEAMMRFERLVAEYVGGGERPEVEEVIERVVRSVCSLIRSYDVVAAGLPSEVTY